MTYEIVVQLRSAKIGRVTCPLKTDYPQQAVPIFDCRDCEYHKGVYKLPRTVVVACAKPTKGEWASGIAVLPLSTVETLPKI